MMMNDIKANSDYSKILRAALFLSTNTYWQKSASFGDHKIRTLSTIWHSAFIIFFLFFIKVKMNHATLNWLYRDFIEWTIHFACSFLRFVQQNYKGTYRCDKYIQVTWTTVTIWTYHRGHNINNLLHKIHSKH